MSGFHLEKLAKSYTNRFGKEVPPWGRMSENLGKLKKAFVKKCGTEHTYRISRQSDDISRWGILGGISPPPRGATEGNFEKRIAS